MSQYVEGPLRTLKCNGALGQYLRVKFPSGTLALAGASDDDIGTMENPTFSGAIEGTVRLRTAAGSRFMIANGAISAGATCYAAASGKIASTGTIIKGQALEAATADGDIIEVVPIGNPSVAAASAVVDTPGAVTATGSAQNDAAALAYGANLVTGADGTKGVLLPAQSIGQTVRVYNQSSSTLKVWPTGTNTIAGGSASASVSVGAHKSAVFLAEDGTDWSETLSA